MVHSDVNDILIQKDVKMSDWKEWVLTIIVLPVFILGFAVLWIIMVVTILISMFIEWWTAISYKRRI